MNMPPFATQIKKKNLEIQIEYIGFGNGTACPQFTQAKMHDKTHTEYFYSMNSSLKKMDDFTINKILSNKVTKDSFIGVFSSDTLPSYAQTGYYVVNLDTSQQPSSHWIAIKISKSKCKNEYFDSYGLGPPTVRFKRFMKYNYIYNSKRLQHSLSTTCAQWCIYYIWRKCQGWSLRNILKPFYSKDFLINDHVLNLVVNNNFKINRKVIDKEFVKIQIARKTAEKNIRS